MALCKFCGKVFDWGRTEDGYVPLVSIERQDGLLRNFQDENGVLRADHRLECVNRGGPTVRIVRLAKGIEPENIIGKKEKIDPETGEISCTTTTQSS